MPAAVLAPHSSPRFQSLHLHLKERKLLNSYSWEVLTAVTAPQARLNLSSPPTPFEDFLELSSSIIPFDSSLSRSACLCDWRCSRVCLRVFLLCRLASTVVWVAQPWGQYPTKQAMGPSTQRENWFRMRGISNLQCCHGLVDYLCYDPLLFVASCGKDHCVTLCLNGDITISSRGNNCSYLDSCVEVASFVAFLFRYDWWAPNTPTRHSLFALKLIRRWKWELQDNQSGSQLQAQAETRTWQSNSGQQGDCMLREKTTEGNAGVMIGWLIESRCLGKQNTKATKHKPNQSLTETKAAFPLTM